LANAETNRQLTIEERRLKASAVTQRVNVVVERVTDRLTAVAKRTDIALQAAEERRIALCAERTERLNARGTRVTQQKEHVAHSIETRVRQLGEQLHARLEQVSIYCCLSAIEERNLVTVSRNACGRRRCILSM
jgi:hypothetical protein